MLPNLSQLASSVHVSFYCNSQGPVLLYGILYDMSQRNLDRLQRVQNSLTRALPQAPHHTSVTELQLQLHWMPIRQRVDFKLGTVTFRAIHAGVPSYLASELHRHQPSRTLRSDASTVLQRPHATSDFHRFFRSLGSGCLEQRPCCCS